MELKTKNFKGMIYLGAIVFLFIFLLINRTLAVNATVRPESNFYVTDYQGILTDEVRNHILAVNNIFEQTKEQPQIAVVIVDSLNGQTVEQYALEQFERMGIGNSKYDNGLLILLATGDRKIRIEVGYGLEGTVTDGAAGRILDLSMDYLSKNEFSNAILFIFNQLVLKVQNEYGYDDVFNGKVSAIPSENIDLIGMVMGAIIYFTFIGFASFLIHVKECKKDGIGFRGACRSFWDEDSGVGNHHPRNRVSRGSSGAGNHHPRNRVSRGSSGGFSSGRGGRSGGGGASRSF